jgi:WD40 repeat protein
LATALARRPYGEDDVQWALEHAGAFILEVADKGRSVYRLYHEALAHSLRSNTRKRDLQESFVKVLIESVPLRADISGPDWQLANPYVRKHLAAHAAACGRLGELLADPLFLLAADPARLQASLSGAESPLPREIVHTYLRAVHHLQTKPMAEAASYLELAAHQSGALDFAERITRLPLRRQWSVGCVRWQPANMHRIVARHTKGKVALSQIAGQAAVVSLARDNTMQLTRLVDGVALAAPWQVEAGPWAVSELDGQPVVVTAGADSVLRIRLLPDGKLLREIPASSANGGITALALTTVGNTPVAVIGSKDGTISVWDLNTAQHLGDSKARLQSAVRAVAVGELPQGPVIVSVDGDGSLQRWKLGTMRALGKPIQPFSREVFAIATSSLTKRPVFICAGHDGDIWIADLATGKPAPYSPIRDERWFGPEKAHWCLALGLMSNNRPALAAGGNDGVIRIWDVTDGTPIGHLVGHDGFVNSVAMTGCRGRLVIVSSGAHDNTVRVWDQVAEEAERPPAAQSSLEIRALAVGQCDGQPVIFTASFDDVQAWSLRTGVRVRAPMRLPRDWVSLKTVFGYFRGRLVLASGLRDDVRVWDIAAGTRVGRRVQLPADPAATGTIEGRLCIVCIEKGYSRKSTLWTCDVMTGRFEEGPAIAEWLHVAALGTLGGRAVIALGGLFGRVEIRAFADSERGFQLLQTLQSPHKGILGAIAFGSLGEHPFIATGDRGGMVELWHPNGTKYQEYDLGACVTALSFGEQPLLVAGTEKGFVVLDLSEVA